MGDVVDDSNREVAPGTFFAQFIKDRLHHRRSKLFRRQSIASGDHGWFDRERWIRSGARLSQRSHHVKIERITWRSRFFGAIEHGDPARCLRQRRQESRLGKRPIESDFEDADFLAAAGQLFHGLVHRFGARAHNHDHAFGCRVSFVVEQVVLTAGAFGEPLHRALNDVRAVVIKHVSRLARLEEHIRVLRRAAHYRFVGSKRAPAMLFDCRFGDQAAQVIVAEFVNLADFVRRAEAIEKMEEGNA